MKIIQLADINPSPDVPVACRKHIDYIDTASVVEGRLCCVQRLAGAFPSRAQREIRANDILISSVRPNLRHNYFVSQNENCMIASSGFIHIRVNNPEKVSPQFLYYFLTSPTQVQRYVKIADSSQSAYPSFNKDVIEGLEFPDLPLPTQLRIAGVLGSIDEKIELNRKKIAELEALAKTIYDYWFVQFDFPDATGRPYKSSGGKMVWNGQLKREVPEGWGMGTIGELGEIVSGGTPSTSNADYWSSKGIAWITPKDLSVTSNKYIRHGEHDISENGLLNSSAQLMPRKSVLLSTRAPIGYIAVADCDLCTNQGFKSIVPNKNFGSEFIYYTVSAMIPFVKTLGVGSTFAEVSKRSLSSVQLIIPPLQVCDRFDDVVSSIGNERLIGELEIENLEELRDALLPLLMNGQVVVG